MIYAELCMEVCNVFPNCREHFILIFCDCQFESRKCEILQKYLRAALKFDSLLDIALFGI